MAARRTRRASPDQQGQPASRRGATQHPDRTRRQPVGLADGPGRAGGTRHHPGEDQLVSRHCGREQHVFCGYRCGALHLMSAPDLGFLARTAPSHDHEPGRTVALFDVGETIVFRFRALSAVIVAPARRGPDSCDVRMGIGSLDVRFGPLRLSIWLGNVDAAEVTGSYRSWLAFGPRLGLEPAGCCAITS